MKFGAMIIGDEIISGKRQDAHFSALLKIFSKRGLRLSWVKYLGDDRGRLTRELKESFALGEVVFSFGGIGNTPDDHTRQAAAEALGVKLCLHPDAEREIRGRFGDGTDERRLLLGTFPQGVDIVPNPFNRIPGFSVKNHFFLPGFPQMSHPMVEWALDTYFSHLFNVSPTVDKAFLLTGDGAYESALLDLMERIVREYPTLRLFSLPSVRDNGERRHLELGVEGELTLVDEAMDRIRAEIEKRGITWKWREDT